MNQNTSPSAPPAGRGTPTGSPPTIRTGNTWQRRARLGQTLATTLGVPLEQSSVTDNPQRLSDAAPGDLLIVTDPNSKYQCRFVPDPDETQTLLLLDECPDCTDPVPITQVATLADLSAYLDAEHPGYEPSDG